ncbi:hypothetical protein BGX31_007867 [Mortierella sp. GBA43]|nr:hypothetical protein BGX31_007867 [Mortierella sp. GBA43]
MSVNEDERKQRFRFHKDDEIVLLDIVLEAKPCPYSITSRDGAIMMAWNDIAEKFKVQSQPRPDGKLPLPRTCRTRCDKMIDDYLQMRAYPNHKKQKQESKEDRKKNERLEKLARLQGRISGDPVPYDASDSIGDTDSTSTGPGTAGSNVLPTGQLILQDTPASSTSSSSSSSSVALHANDSNGQALVPSHTHPSYRNVASTTSSALVPQSTLNLGHRTNQPTSDILVTPTSQDAIATSATASMGTRKRKNTSTGETTTTTASVSVLQRSGSTTLQFQQSNLTTSTNSRRPRPIAIKPSPTSPSPNAHILPINSHHSRSALSSMISNSLGPTLQGQGLPLQTLNVAVQGDSDDNEEEDDEDEDEDDTENQGLQDASEDLGNNYDDDDVTEAVNHHGGERSEVASLIALQNGSTANRTDTRRASRNTGPAASGSSAAVSSKYGRTASSQSLQRHASNSSLLKTPLSPLFSGGILSNGGYQIPSQMTPEDRTYIMRTLALEEKKVKVEVDKIALEREKLALERTRLEWEMKQVNS